MKKHIYADSFIPSDMVLDVSFRAGIKKNLKDILLVELFKIGALSFNGEYSFRHRGYRVRLALDANRIPDSDPSDLDKYFESEDE